MTHKARLVVDRDHLIAMVRDPEFYDECPAYAHLRDTALRSWAMYKQAVAAGTCGDCAGSTFKYMIGVVDAFWLKTRELKDAGNLTALRTVKAYLEKRKCYTVDQVVLYYRRSRKQGKIGKFVIT